MHNKYSAYLLKTNIMPNLVAYNSGGPISNALQFGTIVMDVNNTVNPGSLLWCPDYGICNQYFIITDSYTNGKTSQPSSVAMGFPTTGLTDSALISGINKLAASKSSGPFTGLTGAITWAISEGYFIINQEYPSIVTSGSVLNLDASLPASYPLVLNNWYDLSGNGNTGTLNNSVTYSSLSYGNLVFNSSNSDYISFSGTSNIPSGNSNYTISSWFNPSSLGNKGLVGWGNYGSSNEVNAFRLTSTGLVNYWGANDLNVNVSLSTGTWYNAVATFDGTTRQIWLNGSSIASDTPTGHNVTITNNLTVGNTNNIPYEYFDGKIGEVQIFNRALTSTEITQNYNALLPRYNGTYTDPCISPIYCVTPTPTSTIVLTPTQTPTLTQTPTSTSSPITHGGDVFYGCLPQVDPCGNLSANSYLYWSGPFGEGTVLYTNSGLTASWGGILGCDPSAICHIDASSVGSLSTFNLATASNIVGSIYDNCGEPTPTPTPTPTTTPTCPYYISNIYDDSCTLVYSNVIVSPNITPILNYYYRGSGLGDGTIVQFLSLTCDFPTYFTTIIAAGSFSCPPPA